MNERKYKRSLRYSVLVSCFFFTFFTCILMGIVGYLIYRSDMIKRYQIYARDAIEFLVREIDGDDLAECMKTGKKSKKYEKLQRIGNDLKESHGLEFIYIIEPLKIEPPDNMMDVFAAYTAAGKAAGTDGLTDLGKLTQDAYPADVAKEYMARMDKDPTVTYFRNDTDFGNIYTAIRPVFDSSGEPIAVICADVLIDEINRAAFRYLLYSLIAAMLAGVILLTALRVWFGKRIIQPISLLEKAAGEFVDKCRSRADVDQLVVEQPKIRTGDEIESLSNALSSLMGDVQNYAADLVSAGREINTMKETLLKMDALAYRDSLTGAGNKAAYEKMKTRLDFEILSNRAEFSLVMLDLNFLKKINDAFGHDRGNIYIKNMYQMVSSIFTESPIFRIGGDEFVVIAEDQEHEDCDKRIQVLKKRMSALLDDKSLEPWEKVSTAIGSASFISGTDLDVDSVFKRADISMYENKKEMHAERQD